MGQSPIKAGSNIAAAWPTAHPGCWNIPEQIQIERIRYLCEKCPELEFAADRPMKAMRGSSCSTVSVSRSPSTSRGLSAGT
jgi:hypothetical protein